MDDHDKDDEGWVHGYNWWVEHQERISCLEAIGVIITFPWRLLGKILSWHKR